MGVATGLIISAVATAASAVSAADTGRKAKHAGEQQATLNRQAADKRQKETMAANEKLQAETKQADLEAQQKQSMYKAQANKKAKEASAIAGTRSGSGRASTIMTDRDTLG